MDIEAIFKKAIQPYEARVFELQEADKRKESEIKELKTAILEMHKLVKDYNAHNVSAIPAKAKQNPQARPQTAILPNKASKPESYF